MIKTKQNKTKQNKTKQNKTKQNKTKQNKTKHILQNLRVVHRRHVCKCTNEIGAVQKPHSNI